MTAIIQSVPEEKLLFDSIEAFQNSLDQDELFEVMQQQVEAFGVKGMLYAISAIPDTGWITIHFGPFVHLGQNRLFGVIYLQCLFCQNQN